MAPSVAAMPKVGDTPEDRKPLPVDRAEQVVAPATTRPLGVPGVIGVKGVACSPMAKQLLLVEWCKPPNLVNALWPDEPELLEKSRILDITCS